MEIKGIIKQVGKTQVLSDKFSKRELILKTDYESKYPQYIVVQFTNANITKLDSVQPGEVVTVSINLRGREWTSPQGEVKYFNSLEAWRIEGNAAGASNNNSGASMNDVAATFTAASQEDDLPF